MWSSLRVCLFLMVLVVSMQHGCSKSASCLKNDDCEPTHFCQQRRCVKKCTDDLDCAPPNKCQKRDGTCAPAKCEPNTDARCLNGQLYYFDSCGTQGAKAETCAYGCALDRCSPPPSCGNGACDPLVEGCSVCPKDCPCASAFTCDANKCVASTICKSNEECSKGLSCLGGKCTPNCKLETDCQAGERCEQGKCTKPPIPCGDGTCDIAKGESCDSCAKDCACATGQVCEAGSCKDDKGCKVETDCPALHNCLHGKCVGHCGNSKCEPQENCGTCAQDCACQPTESCKQDACVADCGDGTCDASKGENCGTCAQDCPCLGSQACKNGTCESACPGGLADQWTCTGTKLERCGPSSNFKPESRSCPSGCLNSNCCACSPGTYRCSGQDLEVCNSSCTGWDRKQTCKSDSHVCDASKKTCACKTSCKYDEHSCRSSSIRTVCVRSGSCTFWKDSQEKFQCGKGNYKDEKYCVKGTCCRNSSCR